MAKFQLTYLTFTDKQKMLGHACVGITEVKDNGDRELIFRVGLFPTNQVELEDFIKPKPGRHFREESFDITEEQLSHVLHKINCDRRLEVDANNRRPRKAETKTEVRKGLQSTPLGPEYSKMSFNCKDYALSVVKSAGIDTTHLQNFGVSVPLLSGSETKEVILVPESTQHTEALVLESREEKKQFLTSLLASLLNLIAILKPADDKTPQESEPRGRGKISPKR